MNTLSSKLTIKSKKSWMERLMDAYDKGFHDGYETGMLEYRDYVLDMEEMKDERKEVGVV